MPRRLHIAQLNIAHAIAPIDDPRMAEFTSQIDAINAIAESSPGFVWRLSGNVKYANGAEVFGDPSLLVNLSVWESIEHLEAFTYRSAHTGPLRDRAKWFHKPTEPGLVLWWQPAGEIPDLAEGARRLAFLRRHGPSPMAFSLRQRFAPPAEVNLNGRVFCAAENTANGETSAATKFEYRQDGATVWATYSGGEVRFGTLLAKVDGVGLIDMRYQHVSAAGEWRSGMCWSAPELLPDGRVRLHERWQWTSGDQSHGASTLEEVR